VRRTESVVTTFSFSPVTRREQRARPRGAAAGSAARDVRRVVHGISLSWICRSWLFVRHLLTRTARPDEAEHKLISNNAGIEPGQRGVAAGGVLDADPESAGTRS
jgi:hypothetical protein